MSGHPDEAWTRTRQVLMKVLMSDEDLEWQRMGRALNTVSPMLMPL
jgi:hypothetical protein